mmetsp:Transcript_24457/g.68554  ORF Transcript_24457/g.68554 Transcript_24457/m.68554 type:complete len:276 (+) Transcript_24457:224-1051(+)|eukprot:CAMPEP_0119122334 /NCGR_PEP_ID=MMETSP1310-20130426/2620_1 /TAXON_ID=464262 /ORGANISM="Genus nov. species nov., Strain RCC2339" /LENGTH=275 /DNA_ID=CAMNT_0007111975 /DNA_START=190 /DNA_END=1017 /DNA_ORIENTATION=+
MGERRRTKGGGDGVRYTVVVPTYKEVDNLRPLVERTMVAMEKDGKGKEVEIIVVDDNSQDGSDEVVESLRKEGHPVRIVVRVEDRGLSSAVLEGFDQGKGDLLLCMDADLQHPPEQVPALFRAIDPAVAGSANYALGTRYGGGELSIDKDWPLHRRVISAGARLLAIGLTNLSDPMSGFFAVSRSLFHEHRGKINATGFKIAMEVYVKCGVRKHNEVPIKFGVRLAGESKLSSKVMIQYLVHLYELYTYKYGALLFVLLLSLVISFSYLLYSFYP